MAAGTMGRELSTLSEDGRKRALTFVCLTEGTQDGDFVSEDLGWWPGYTSGIGIDTIHDKFTTSSDVVNSVFQDGHAAGGFDDNVKSMRVLILNFLKLWSYRSVLATRQQARAVYTNRNPSLRGRHIHPRHQASTVSFRVVYLRCCFGSKLTLFASSIFRPSGAATTTWHPPFWRSS